MRILLIDDNKNDMKPFCDELILEGHDILQAFCLDDIKQIIDNKEIFDGIILDLMFPPKNGIPIDESEYGYLGGKYIYQKYLIKEYKDIPFLILTAMDESTKMYQDVKDKFTKMYNSFLGIFQKPVEIDDIIKAFKINLI